MQPDNSNESTLIQTSGAPRDRAEIEPARRAPTLMAGEVPGSQGAARVWSPDRWSVRAEVMWHIAWIIPVLLFVLLGWGSMQHDLHSDSLGNLWTRIDCLAVGFLLLAAVVFGFFCSVAGVCSRLRRPLYLTTDDAGLAVTTRKGARSVRWAEVVEVESFGTTLLRLKVGTEKMRVSLEGHSRRARETFRSPRPRRSHTPAYRDPTRTWLLHGSPASFLGLE